MLLIDIGTHWASQVRRSASGRRRRRPTEVVVIPELAAYIGRPILSFTFDLEDSFLIGFISGGVIPIDALGSNIMNGAGGKSQGSNREVVKVPLELAVLEIQHNSSEILSANKMCRKRYLCRRRYICRNRLFFPPLEFKFSITLPQMLDSHSSFGGIVQPRYQKGQR